MTSVLRFALESYLTWTVVFGAFALAVIGSALLYDHWRDMIVHRRLDRWERRLREIKLLEAEWDMPSASDPRRLM